ncbi:MAG: type I secretion system permease/ATPase [Gammaproteobacteria bacterium]|nr:type I secretion system permease/ATPase [Gammaproteobacteria bacterium]MDH3535029.1 type I secretion system permease/ATPase [Gammaproteobacteria bacterium]
MIDPHHQYDPLLECLVIFAKIHNRPISVEALIAGLPVEPGADGPELFSIEKPKGLFSRVAARAGFASRLIHRELDKLSRLLLPCILVLKNGNACILESIDRKNRRAKVIFPEIGEGEEWLELERLKKEYLGYAFLLKREFQLDSEENKKSVVKDSTHWFWGTLAKSRDIFASVLLSSILINIFILATPMFTMNVYDKVVPNDAIATLWVLAAGIVTVYLFDTVLRFVRNYLLEVAGKKSDIIMSSIIFSQVLNLKMDQWPASIGAFASQLREFESIRNFFTASTLATLVDLPFAVIFLLVIYYIGGPMIAVPLIVIGLLLLYSFILVKPLKATVEATYEATAKKNAHLIETLQSIKTVKALGASNYSQWVWEESSGTIADKSMRARMLSTSIIVVTNLLVQFNTIGLIVFGIYRIGNLELSLGGLIAIVMLSSRAVAPMGQMAALITSFEQTKTAFRSLDELMHKAVERPEGKSYVRRSGFDGTISFRNVDFSYPESTRKSLSDIRFRINAGEHVGFIGKVGSGKTTLLKLIIGLYQPENGSIAIDNIDINQIDPADLRKNIGYLSQDIELLRGTIRENIAYKNLQVNDERLIEAASVCGVDLFVNQLPQGFDTQVGESGSFLSGGQRQAIALGRAVLLNEPMLILDEPTNSFDNTTESIVKKRLFDYSRDKTLLLVTHKAPMLELVERLIVVDDGKIVMDGPKEDVLKALKGTANA